MNSRFGQGSMLMLLAFTLAGAGGWLVGYTPGWHGIVGSVMIYLAAWCMAFVAFVVRR